jgi:phosphotransacetylase
MNLLMLPGRTVFIADTYVNYDPSAEQLADMTLLAAGEIRNFGMRPKVALLSHSTFGTEDTPTAVKMRQTLALLNQRAPGLEVDGEMHGDAALDEQIRLAAFPNSRLKGQANLLIMPTLDAANISFNLLKVAAGDNLTVGPVLTAARPRHLTPTATCAASSISSLTVATRRDPSEVIAIYLFLLIFLPLLLNLTGVSLGTGRRGHMKQGLKLVALVGALLGLGLWPDQ